MGIKIKAKSKNRKVSFDLVLEERTFVDTVFKVRPMVMGPSDSLEVVYDLQICGYTNDRLTSTIYEQYSYITQIKKLMTIQFIRFTKYRSKATIQIFENRLATDLSTTLIGPVRGKSVKVYPQ